MDEVKLPCEGVIVQLLRQKLDLSDGLLDDLEESGNLQEVARAMLLEATRPTLVTDELVERVNVKWFSQELREIFRRHFIAWGDSTDWEKIARKALDSLRLRASLAAMPTLVTGQLDQGVGAALAGADDWEVGPCVDRLGHVTSWDISVRPQQGDRGVAVIASVYSGAVVARAILAAIQTAAVEARRAALTRMVQLDEELGLYDDGEQVPPATRQGDAHPQPGPSK